MNAKKIRQIAANMAAEAIDDSFSINNFNFNQPPKKGWLVKIQELPNVKKVTDLEKLLVVTPIRNNPENIYFYVTIYLSELFVCCYKYYKSKKEAHKAALLFNTEAIKIKYID